VGESVSDEEIYILHLMYRDLAERIVDRKINMENFLLFFHKNGFWGDRLFREFDYDETNLISEEEFIRGIGTPALTQPRSSSPRRRRRSASSSSSSARTGRNWRASSSTSS
jgi:hypothetical protein